MAEAVWTTVNRTQRPRTTSALPSDQSGEFAAYHCAQIWIWSHWGEQCQPGSQSLYLEFGEIRQLPTQQISNIKDGSFMPSLDHMILLRMFQSQTNFSDDCVSNTPDPVLIRCWSWNFFKPIWNNWHKFCEAVLVCVDLWLDLVSLHRNHVYTHSVLWSAVCSCYLGRHES